MSFEVPRALEEAAGYTFVNPRYLEIALTHSSYANENHGRCESNERQEFLGDAVLSIVVSDYLFHNFKHFPEGELTKMRASLVCEKTLSRFSKELGLGGYLMFGHGEEQMGGRERPSILCDSFEAFLAAIYLDGGMEPAREFVLRFIKPSLEDFEKVPFKDYKTQLQEIIQQNPEEQLTYMLIEETGPDHDKRFVVEVMLNSNPIGRGEGRSKKAAEQMAAREALELMGE